MKILISLIFCLTLIGCNSNNNTTKKTIEIPAGCENSFIYKHADVMFTAAEWTKVGLLTMAAVKPDFYATFKIGVTAARVLIKSGQPVSFDDLSKLPGAAKFIVPAFSVAFSSTSASLPLDACDLKLIDDYLSQF